MPDPCDYCDCDDCDNGTHSPTCPNADPPMNDEIQTMIDALGAHPTADQLIELWDASDENITPTSILIDDILMRHHRLTTAAQLAHLRDELTPCCSEYHTDEEPHGMHSDDGHDYLQAALDLSSELIELETAQCFYNWLNDKIHNEDKELTNYATDGISDAIYTLFPNAFSFEGDEV